MKIEDKLQQICSYLKQSNDYTYRNSLLQYLKNKNNYNYMSMFDKDTLADILRVTIDCDTECTKAINTAKGLYNTIVYDKNDTEQYELFLKFFRLSQITNWTNYKNEFFLKVYPMFENKKLVLGIFTEAKEIVTDDFSYTCNYILYARRYYVDENAFYSSILDILYKIKFNGYYKMHQHELIKQQLAKDKQLAGIYDIDENELNNLFERFHFAFEQQEKLDQSIEDINKKLDKLNLNFDIKLKQSDEILNEKIESSTFLVENYSNKIDEILKQKDNTNKDSLIEVQNYFKELKNMMDEFKEKLQNYNKKIKQTGKTNTGKSKIVSQLLENKTVSILNKLKKEIDKYEEIDYSPKIDIIIKEEIMNFLADKEISDKKFKMKEEEERFFLLYYFSLYNNSYDIFEELYLKIDVSDIRLEYLDKDLIAHFNRAKYVDYIVRYKSKLDYLLESLEFYQVEEILDKNPEFEISPSSFYLKEAIKIFGIDEIFLEQNQTLIENLSVYRYGDYYNIIKKIYDIDANFIIRNRYIFVINDVFSYKEITEFTDEQQDRIEQIHEDSTTYTEDNKEIIRKLIYHPEKIYLNSRVVRYIKSFGNIDTYLKFDYDDSRIWLNLCYNYCGDNISKRELIKENKKLVKKYKLKEKYPHRGDLQN